MKIELITRSVVRKIISEETMSKFDYLSKENTILRKKLRKLEEEIEGQNKLQ